MPLGAPRWVSTGRMFSLVTETWNPVTGCRHDCSYCWARRLALGRLRGTGRYRNGFEPRLNPEELRRRFSSGVVFVSDMGDLFGEWVPAEWIRAVIGHVSRFPGTLFLFMTKNPARYLDFADEFPGNVILGATIETNRDSLASRVSRAPPPSARARRDRGKLFPSLPPLNRGGGMRFVRRDPAGAHVTFAHATSARRGSEAERRLRRERFREFVRRFEELCGRLGGEFDYDGGEVVCWVRAGAVDALGDHVGELHSLVREFGPALGHRLVQLKFLKPLPGDWEEFAEVLFDPDTRSYRVTAQVYSGGVPPEGLTAAEEIEREEPLGAPLHVKLIEEAFVDQNPVTGELAGVGSASADLPLGRVREGAQELRLLVDRVIGAARRLAEEAREKLIVPAEE